MRLQRGAQAVALFLVALPLPATGQVRTLSVAGVGCRARDAVIFLGSKEAAAGWCVGALGEFKLGPLVLEASGFRGRRLEPTQGTALTRDGGEVRGVVGVSPVPWATLEAGFALRAFRSAAGYQRWRIPSGGFKLSTALGDPSITAYLRAHYMPPMLQAIPAGQATGDAKWDLGLIAESGLRIAPRKTPLFFGTSYRLERYDFPGGAAARLEQFEVLSVYAGVRLGK